MRGQSFSAEVCVVGGGPAGAACALRLARLGYDVLLVERAPRGRPHVGESLPASVLPLLDEMQVREAVEGAGFLRPRGALVRWDAVAHAPAQPDGEPGFQVDRGRFDALLLAAAQAQGARVLRGTALPAQVAGAVRLPLQDGGEVQAQWLVLAHGRRASARQGPRTAALYAYWDAVPSDDPRTRVEAAAEAWYWGAPLPDGSFNATVLVDAGRCAGLDAAQREAWYRELLSQSGLLRGCLAGRPRGRVQVCDATPRADPHPVRGRVLKAGEAAFSIDPLSSQGVQAALRSGWQAAACVHTMARRPDAYERAAAFHREQTRRVAAHHARLAAGFHASAARRFGTAFWLRRAEGSLPPSLPAPRPLPPLQAWVALDGAAGWAAVPSLEGDFVVLGEALSHPALDAPVARIGRWPMRRVLGPLLRRPVQVGELLSAWHADCGEAAAIQLLAQLWRQGIVVPAAAGWSSA
jgi:flavin-dependent dehydrogenase